jgi:DNA helicase-2/ATP-dependent DNA helicase PcrA
MKQSSDSAQDDMKWRKDVHLDESQRRFCALDDGSIRLLAPAGSGKTHSLLHRCRALAERSDKLRPRFLVFTFTRAARDELRERLKTDPAFQQVAPFVTITTLNSWGFREIRSRTTHPKLITTGKDRYGCIHNVLQPLWQNYPRLKPLLEDYRRKNKAGLDVLDLMDFLKSMGFRHDRLSDVKTLQNHMDYLQQCGMATQLERFFERLVQMEIIRESKGALDQVYTHFITFWREACDQLYRSALFSLEDQKYWARIHLENQLEEGRMTTGSARVHHVLVDEFQDINPLDLSLLKAITRLNNAQLTIVGDDDQAIYEWRGATPEFILEPEKHIGGTYETCILTTNYRSPRNIVELSQKLINHNKRRVPKQVRAAKTEDALIQIRRFPSITRAVEDTVALVKELLHDDQVTSVALIGRKRSQIIPYQIVFAGENIPFYAAEDLHVLLSGAFEELKEILAIRARASLGVPFASDPIQDVLKLCDKVKRYPLSKKDREALLRHLYKSRPANLRDTVSALFRYQGSLKGNNEGGRMSTAFAEAISHFLAARSVAESIEAVSNHFDGLQKDYGKAMEDIFYTDPPFLYLAEFAQRYGEDYGAFYRDIESAIATLARVPSDVEEETDEEQEPQWKLPLHLMTALRAKGKEFDVVIVLDANDGIWPSKLARTENDLEQERRLFYVAMTRARRRLYFMVNESILGEPTVPSPYLAEMGLTLSR